jgi:hypothetical protein
MKNCYCSFFLDIGRSAREATPVRDTGWQTDTAAACFYVRTA